MRNLKHRLFTVGIVWLSAACLAVGFLLASCRGAQARSKWSFDEIRRLTHGKTAAQVVELLGEPDSRQVVFDEDERWIWWNYTFLDGNDYPPEQRGSLVHLEIVFKNPARTESRRLPYDNWTIDEAFGVTFKMVTRESRIRVE